MGYPTTTNPPLISPPRRDRVQSPEPCHTGSAHLRSGSTSGVTDSAHESCRVTANRRSILLMAGQGRGRHSSSVRWGRFSSQTVLWATLQGHPSGRHPRLGESRRRRADRFAAGLDSAEPVAIAAFRFRAFARVVDGLKGFPKAITAVFPHAIVQTCIVHLIRNSMDFASSKDRKPIAAELKANYRRRTWTCPARCPRISTPAPGSTLRGCPQFHGGDRHWRKEIGFGQSARATAPR